MVLLGIDEQEKRAGPIGKDVTGIDYVIAGHDAGMQVGRRANTWCIRTGAGFPAMNRLTLARTDVDPPEIGTFEVIDRCIRERISCLAALRAHKRPARTMGHEPPAPCRDTQGYATVPAQRELAARGGTTGATPMKTHDCPHPNPATVRHGPNPVGGRDLVIGDLHGEFDTLEHALDTLGFQPARDRLFTVGDLIDRGPRSADALEWLENRRFAGSVRGNHEQMMNRALTSGEAVLMRMNGPGAMWLANGADWWYESAAVSEARRQDRRVPKGAPMNRWLEAIAGMPYLALIEYGSRRVGLVHSPGAADYEAHWEQIWKQAESVPAPGARAQESARQQLEYALLWRDPRRRAARHDDPKLDEALEGVDLVVSGHCPSLWPIWTRRNVVTIDTGVHYEALGHLTIAEVQDGLTLHRVARTETFPQTEKSHR